jgi:GNAT superfamily N-acetyltransferase
MVRGAVFDDLAAVLTLYRELRPHDPPFGANEAVDTWRAILADPALHVLVAEMDGALVSTCMLAVIASLPNRGQPFAIIEHVVTARAARGRGLGRQVLQAALNQAWSAGCYKVVLLSGLGRGDAHRLYEGLGFRGDVERGFVAKRPGG